MPKNLKTKKKEISAKISNSEIHDVNVLKHSFGNGSKLEVPIVKKRKTEKASATTNIDTSALEKLLLPFDVSDFLQNYWEKKPLVIHRKGEIPISLNHEVFSKSILEELIQKEDIRFTRDIHTCRCVNGATKDQHANKTSKVTLKEFNRLFDKVGATMQFHQPQRFLNPLWDLMEKLESFFSCLVGANAYVTPIGTQGLAPHYDDVEVFIIQIEGEKHWRLYEAPVKHAREYKSNLSSDSIGKPTHDFVLGPGDVLYMPRGTIHQADSPVVCKSHSTHITLSTYQKNSWGDYLLTSFPEILEMALTKSDTFRKGLPIGSLLSARSSLEYFSKLMSELPEIIKSSDNLPTPHSLIEDFMLSRLPPYKISLNILEEGPEGFPPTIASSIRLAYPKHTAFFMSQSPDNDNDSDDEVISEDGTKSLFVYVSLFNDRRKHMISSKDELNLGTGTLKFPASHFEAMQQLVTSADLFYPIKNLSLSSASEKVHFAMALWAQHCLVVQ